MIRQLLPVALVSMCAFAAALPEAEGDFTWGGRKAHSAVVNPVMGNEAGSIVSLRGEWEFTPHAGNLGRNGIWKPFYKTKAWPDVRAIQVPACWEAQANVGSGKALMAFGLNLLAETPEAAALLDGLVDYAASDRFAPKSRVEMATRPPR